MRTLVLLVLALLAPAAAAEPHYEANVTCLPDVPGANGCAGEYDVGGCDDMGEHHVTGASGGVAGAAGFYAAGRESCFPVGGLRVHVIEASAGAYDIAGASFVWGAWTSDAYWGDGCVTQVGVFVASVGPHVVDLGCPAGGPPNPGWGMLLP